jgi:hypothetical protein
MTQHLTLRAAPSCDARDLIVNVGSLDKEAVTKPRERSPLWRRLFAWRAAANDDAKEPGE